MAVEPSRTGLNFKLATAIAETTDIAQHRPGQRQYAVPLVARGEVVGHVVTTLTCFLHSPPDVRAEIVWKDT